MKFRTPASGDPQGRLRDAQERLSSGRMLLGSPSKTLFPELHKGEQERSRRIKQEGERRVHHPAVHTF